MGGYGSGRTGGRPTVESGLSLNIDRLIRRRWLVPGTRSQGTISWTNNWTEHAGSVRYEANLIDPNDAWIRLKFAATDYWTGERHEVDQLIWLATTRPHFGGARWWFMYDNCRVGRLHLPPGGRRFASRRAYRLAYASQRGSAVDRAHRGKAKIKARLIADLDPDEWDLPPKPKWMRWRTYNRYVEKFDRYEGFLDQETAVAAARLLRRWG
jgi:hypothetical protein